MRVLASFLALGLFLNSLGANEIGNGQIFIIQAPSDSQKNLNISIKNNKSSKNKNLHWITNPNDKSKKFAIIAANYKDKGVIIANDKELKIAAQPYKKEQISVNASKVKPPKSALKRIESERDEANKIYSTFNEGLLFNSPFELPMNSKITSPYGGARVFNGELKSFHSGTDFRASIGTQVKASNSGVVRIAKDRYYAGGSVVIDHGSGIYTQYYHLSKINVKVGDKVEKGDIIALSGDTGRVNGPHLHFGVFVSGSQVDPEQFIKHFNKEIFNEN